MKRTLVIKKIKKIKDKTFDLSEGNAVAFIGKNGTGKSTAVQCLETIFSASRVITNPVTKGEESGEITFQGTDLNNKPITIEWEIKNDETGSGRFRAIYIDDDGKTKSVTSVNKIRELMGVYMPLSVQEALYMMRRAEDRKRFIDEFIMPCLKQEEKQEIEEINAKITTSKAKQFEDNLYHSRTKVKNDLNFTSGQIKALEMDKTTMDKISNVEELEKEIEVLKKRETLLSSAIEHHVQRIDAFSKIITAYANEIPKIKDIIDEDVVELLRDHYIKIKQLSVTEENALSEIRDEFNKTKDILSQKSNDLAVIYSHMSAAQKLKEYLKTQENLMSELTEIEEKIKLARQRKQEIFKKSNLPAGLEIEEEEIVFEGFPFDESSVSETKANIAMIKLMSNVSKSQLVNIGDWSKYDDDSKAEIYEYAKKDNRILIGQLVTEDEEVDMVIEII